MIVVFWAGAVGGIRILGSAKDISYVDEDLSSLAQKHAAGWFDLTDELMERIIDASWEAIRQ